MTTRRGRVRRALGAIPAPVLRGVRALPFDRKDKPYLLILVGFALVIRGVWMIDVPWAYIVGGLSAIAVGFWIGLPARDPQ